MQRQPQRYDPRQEMTHQDFELQHKRDLNLKDVALHQHDFYEIYFLITGDVTYLIESKIIHVMPGDILLIPPRTQHQVLIRPEMSVYERYVLWADPRMISQLSSQQSDLLSTLSPAHTGSNQLRLKPEARTEVLSLLQRLDGEIHSADYGADLLRQSLLTQLLVTVNRLLTHQGAQLDEDTRTSTMVAQIINFVNLHYSEDLSLDLLAEKFYVSKFHLSHAFNRQVGTSLYRYIQRKRLLIARQLLAQGQKPSVVSSACGFSDYTCFYRAFKAEYGISPREYAQSAPQIP